MYNAVKIFVLDEKDVRFQTEKAVIHFFIYSLFWRGLRMHLSGRKYKVEDNTLIYFQYKGFIVAKAVADSNSGTELKIRRDSIRIRRARVATSNMNIRIWPYGNPAKARMLLHPAPFGTHFIDPSCTESIDSCCFQFR